MPRFRDMVNGPDERLSEAVIQATRERSYWRAGRIRPMEVSLKDTLFDGLADQISLPSLIEISGDASSGKTMSALALGQLITDQTSGPVAIFDIEKSIIVEQLDLAGCDRSKFVLFRPEDGETARETILRIVNMGLFRAIIIDSLTALLPSGERDLPIGQAPDYAHKELVMKLIRSVMADLEAGQHGTAVICISQIRNEPIEDRTKPVGRTGPSAWRQRSAAPIDLKRLADMRLKFRKRAHRVSADETSPPQGIDIMIETQKLTTGRAFGRALIPFNFVTGFAGPKK